MLHTSAQAQFSSCLKETILQLVSTNILLLKKLAMANATGDNSPVLDAQTQS